MPGFRNIWPWQPDEPPEAGHPARRGCCTHICLTVTSEVCWESYSRDKDLSEHEEASFSSNLRALIPSQRVPRTLGNFCLECLGSWPCRGGRAGSALGAGQRSSDAVTFQGQSPSLSLPSILQARARARVGPSSQEARKHTLFLG